MQRRPVTDAVTIWLCFTELLFSADRLRRGRRIYVVVLLDC